MDKHKKYRPDFGAVIDYIIENWTPIVVSVATTVAFRILVG